MVLRNDFGANSKTNITVSRYQRSEMKNSIRIVRAINIVMLLVALSSCRQSNPYNPPDLGINPFTNGGNERNMIVVISDIHLGAVTKHIANVYEEGELESNRTCWKFRQVHQEGKRDAEREIGSFRLKITSVLF